MEEIATFGAGCFWGVEAAFRKVRGVITTKVGYTGGTTINPTYRQVCSHTTGHAEVVQVKYDSEKISYPELLDIFWRIHTPTVPKGQMFDSSSQYRSVIFYHSEMQKKQAIESRNQLEKMAPYPGEIVTQILPATPFYEAEEYHQCYLEKQGR